MRLFFAGLTCAAVVFGVGLYFYETTREWKTETAVSNCQQHMATDRVLAENNIDTVSLSADCRLKLGL